MRNWGHVQTYVDKAEKIHDVFDHAPDVFGTNVSLFIGFAVCISE